jgi:hypothetical protein
MILDDGPVPLETIGKLAGVKGRDGALADTRAFRACIGGMTLNISIRDKIRSNAVQYLQPGETIQAVFAAQTTSQYWALISWLIIVLRDSYRVVIVTDRRILVCKSGRFRCHPPRPS